MRGLEHIPWLYDTFMWFFEHAGLGRWRHWLVCDAQGRTLDLGTGTGRNLPLYSNQALVVAIDPDRRMLRAARRRAAAVPLVVGRAEELPFRSQSFDSVVSGLVFCTVADPARGLREVGRVLKPEGELRMLEHVRSSNSMRARWQDLIQPAWTWIAGGCHPNRDTEAKVEAAGFKIDLESRRAKNEMRRFRAVSTAR